MYFQCSIGWKLRNVATQTTLQGCTQSYTMMNIQIKEPKMLRHNNKQSTEILEKVGKRRKGVERCQKN